MAYYRWMYRGGRPNWWAKWQNWLGSVLFSLGIVPDYAVTLEVTGRKTGKPIRFPLVMAVVNGERYLVSMLGSEVNWVRNLQATEGRATLHHGKREEVLLREIDPTLRAPILKAYLGRAPGARPHIPLSKDAPLTEFEKIAARYPVFRVEPAV